MTVSRSIREFLQISPKEIENMKSNYGIPTINVKNLRTWGMSETPDNVVKAFTEVLGFDIHHLTAYLNHGGSIKSLEKIRVDHPHKRPDEIIQIAYNDHNYTIDENNIFYDDPSSLLLITEEGESITVQSVMKILDGSTFNIIRNAAMCYDLFGVGPNEECSIPVEESTFYEMITENMPECRHGEISMALHVLDKGPEKREPVFLMSEWWIDDKVISFSNASTAIALETIDGAADNASTIVHGYHMTDLVEVFTSEGITHKPKTIVTGWLRNLVDYIGLEDSVVALSKEMSDTGELIIPSEEIVFRSSDQIRQSYSIIGEYLDEDSEYDD